MSLAELGRGGRGVIVSFDDSNPKDRLLVGRLMEMGMTVGAPVEVSHEAPFGGTIAITVRGSLIALGMNDARVVLVKATK